MARGELIDLQTWVPTIVSTQACRNPRDKIYGLIGLYYKSEVRRRIEMENGMGGVTEMGEEEVDIVTEGARQHGERNCEDDDSELPKTSEHLRLQNQSPNKLPRPDKYVQTHMPFHQQPPPPPPDLQPTLSPAKNPSISSSLRFSQTS